MNMVWVELSILGYATRIFKSEKDALTAEGLVNPPAIEMLRSLAVKQIREQIWNRQNGICIRCPNLITAKTMHMHERVSRGQLGEISLENSVGLCYPCHLGPRSVHPNRQLQFTKRTDKL